MLDNMNDSPFSSIDILTQELKAGRQIILMDDEHRENEGDLVMAADMVTPEHINFMATFGRGLVCLSLTQDYADKFDLMPMVQRNDSGYKTNFTISIEAATGVTTGISAADRAHTIQTVIADHAQKNDIVSPGHVFPLIAQSGGVLTRTGHTEASVDFARLAGKKSAAVICEIMNDDGSMARLDDLIPFAQKHNLKMGTIAQLVEHRIRYDNLITLKDVHEIETPYAGKFKCHIYQNSLDNTEHLALIKGEPDFSEPTYVRMHAINSFEDLIGLNDKRYRQLERALIKLHEKNSGVCVLLRDNRPDALSYALGDIKNPKISGIFRAYGIGAQILLNIGVHEMILLSNSNPETLPALEGYGLSVTSWEAF